MSATTAAKASRVLSIPRRRRQTIPKNLWQLQPPPIPLATLTHQHNLIIANNLLRPRPSPPSRNENGPLDAARGKDRIVLELLSSFAATIARDHRAKSTKAPDS